MNDFQMSFMAHERRANLVAEADRERRARAARKTVARRETRPRTRQLGRGLIFGRVILS